MMTPSRDDLYFDLDEWTKRLGLSLVPDRLLRLVPEDFIGTEIVGPRDLVLTELFRKEIYLYENSHGHRVPAVVHVLGEGEAPVRHMTKLGGVPYRPSDALWIQTDTGLPYRFVAQFDMTAFPDQSLKFPGDILLIFMHPDGPYTSQPEIHGGEPCFRFEWWPLGISPDEIMPLQELPPELCEVPPYFCVPYKTYDFAGPQAMEALQHVDRAFKSERDWTLWELQYRMGCNLIMDAVKIGGIPKWRFLFDEEIPTGKRALCTLPSIYPPLEGDWPFINQPVLRPVVGEHFGILQFFDSGIVNFFWEDDGRVTWYMNIG